MGPGTTVHLVASHIEGVSKSEGKLDPRRLDWILVRIDQILARKQRAAIGNRAAPSGSRCL